MTKKMNDRDLEKIAGAGGAQHLEPAEPGILPQPKTGTIAGGGGATPSEGELTGSDSGNENSTLGQD